jgi:hypothetical protein
MTKQNIFRTKVVSTLYTLYLIIDTLYKLFNKECHNQSPTYVKRRKRAYTALWLLLSLVAALILKAIL